MEFRKANNSDIPRLIELRKKQLIDEGIEPTINIDGELNEFFTNKLADHSLIQWVVEDGKQMVATGAVLFFDFPPSYTNKTGKRAYIANMYTSEDYRGKGIARNLLGRLVVDVKNAGVTKIWLGASAMGRPVYKKFGFKESDEYLELDV